MPGVREIQKIIHDVDGENDRRIVFFEGIGSDVIYLASTAVVYIALYC
jgi:hypothetical protein